VVDSKVLFLSTDNHKEAYYVCGILNSNVITKIIDGYAVKTNRGTDVLKYIWIPKYDENNQNMVDISIQSMRIHQIARTSHSSEISKIEEENLDNLVRQMYENI